jgi:hypothetical protein
MSCSGVLYFPISTLQHQNRLSAYDGRSSYHNFGATQPQCQLVLLLSFATAFKLHELNRPPMPHQLQLFMDERENAVPTQHSKMKITPAIGRYNGIKGHTIKVKIPKRLNSPGVLTDFSLAILVPFLGKDMLSHSRSTSSSCKIISPPNLQTMWL